MSFDRRMWLELSILWGFFLVEQEPYLPSFVVNIEQEREIGHLQESLARTSQLYIFLSFIDVFVFPMSSPHTPFLLKSRL